MVETLASGQGSGGRGWFLARIVPLVVMSVGTGVYANGWTTGRPTALRLGGALIALAGVLCVPAALFARRIARLARHEGLVAVAVGAQTVFLAHHLVQFAQMRRFNLPLPFVVGVSSRLNAEWLSVVWLWLACAALVAAYRGGNRSRLLFVAAAWTLLHSLEQLYLLIQFARVTAALDNFGLARPRAIEMLPGVLGRDGWLARHAGGLRPTLAPLLSAPRAYVHLWWTIGDVVLPALGALAWRRRTAHRHQAEPPTIAAIRASPATEPSSAQSTD